MKLSLAIAALAAVVASSATDARHYTGYHATTYHRSYSYGSDYYTNVSGHSVHRPMRASSRPAGASAHCYDGTWSFSEHARGTCSHHGGVASW